MKFLILLSLFIPTLVMANAVKYVEILNQGYHITPTVYEAFNEPESAKGLDSEQYLKNILSYASDKIQQNYVILNDISFRETVTGIGPSASSVEKNEDAKKVSFSIRELKSCANRSIPNLKKILFHKSLKQDELVTNLEAILDQEKGLVNSRPAGMICGMYMGDFGDQVTNDYVMDIKILMFISSQSEKEVLRFLRVFKLAQQTNIHAAKQLADYFVINFLVDSYLGRSIEKIKLVELKEKFKEKYLVNKTIIGKDGISFEVDLSEARSEVDKYFAEVFHELT